MCRILQSPIDYYDVVNCEHNLIVHITYQLLDIHYVIDEFFNVGMCRIRYTLCSGVTQQSNNGKFFHGGQQKK